MRRLFDWFRSWFAGLLGGRRLRTVVLDELAERLRPGEVYLLGQKGHYWCAALPCPCGCGAVIQLNLTTGTHPRWTARIEQDGTLTLSPSVWRTEGCRTHFFLRAGRIQLVSDRWEAHD
jgi:hypothetical protein